MREKLLLALLCCSQLGCASSSSEITPHYVSPIHVQRLAANSWWWKVRACLQ